MPVMSDQENGCLLPSNYHSLAYRPERGAPHPTQHAGNTCSGLYQGCAPSPLRCWHNCCMSPCKASTPTCPPPHIYTFSYSHTKPLTLNFQLVNLPARFPNRWQVSHMRKTSISSPILQNTRTLEEACSRPRDEITELQ